MQSDWYLGAQKRLVRAVQQLSTARKVESVQIVVRSAARQLVGADGATFVLRAGECCHYVDEDAISPLWKGMKFPLSACISGWAMLNKQPAVIEDIYQDSRIPADAYRPTFVKSLVMVPIRGEDPIGAIGTYWAQRRQPTEQEVEVLQALADTTSVALESAQLYEELERRVEERTRQLELANQELEAFSYSVSHDLRAPLRAISGFAAMLGRSDLGEEERGHLDRIQTSARRMNALIEDLLKLGRITRNPLTRHPLDLTDMARELALQIERHHSGPKVEFRVQDGMLAEADPGLVQAALQNLLENAWKYSSKKSRPRVEFFVRDGVYAVRDNGAGFAMEEAGRLFVPFQRLHHPDDFPGTGVGLATVQRIVVRHGGKIWAEAAPDEGATFFFTLG